MIGTILKKTSKWLLIFLLLVVVILAVAYWTAPSWVPSQVQQFLPPELKIKNLKLQRPGLTQAFISELEIELDGEQTLSAKLKDITLNYSLLNKKLNRIEAKSATISLPEQNNGGSAPFTNVITIPKLPLDDIHLEQASVAGLFVQEVFFSDLSLKQINGQSNHQLNLNTGIEFIGLDFDLAAKIHNNNNLLDKLEAQIQHQQDLIKIKISPSKNSTSAFNWQLDANLNSQNYYPIEGLSTVAIQGSGSFDSKEQLLLQLNKDFNLSVPVELAQINLQPEITQQLTAKGLSLDLTQLNQQARFELKIQETSQVAWDPENYHASLIKGSIPIEISHPLLNTQLTLNQLSLFPNSSLSAPEQQIGGTLAANSQLNNLNYQEANNRISADGLSLKLDSSFSISDSNLILNTNNLSLNLGKTTLKNPSLDLKLPTTQWTGDAKIKQSLIGADELNQRQINLAQSQPISFPLAIDTLSAKLTGLTNQIRLDKQQLVINSTLQSLTQKLLELNQVAAKTTLNLNNNKINGSLSFKDSNFENPQVAIDNFSGKLTWLLSNNKVFSKGQFQYQDEKIPFNYKIDLTKNEHLLELIPLQLRALAISQWLAPILSNYPNLTISGGDLSSPKISGNPFALAFDGALKLSNLNLNYDQLAIINLQLDEQLSSTASMQGTTNGKIEKIEIATGIDIRDLQFFMQHSNQKFKLQDIFGYLLKGSLYIPQLTISPEGMTPFEAQLRRIDLGLLLDALESQSLQIRGLFDFTLPISIRDKGQSINDGSFHSLSAGLLKVDTGPSAETNIAFQALENFHYQQLSGTINYSEAGIYRLKIFLKGSNPDLYDGFPIELTLNIEGNLPNLLYSMLISGDMAKPIIDKYKSGEFDIPEAAQPLEPDSQAESKPQ